MKKKKREYTYIWYEKREVRTINLREGLKAPNEKDKKTACGYLHI